ncbi:MAG: hypothetical protein WDA65_09135 [Christensenellales bacterium]
MAVHILHSDIKRAITSKGFLFGIIGMALVIILSSLDAFVMMSRRSLQLQNGYHAQLVMNALSSDWFTLALPILCALPFTAAFVDDIKSGYIKQYLHRTTLFKYIGGKLTACALSGGLVLFAGIVLCYVLAALVFTPMELAPGDGETAQPLFAQLLLKAATLFFSGAFWSLAGFTFAALTMSKYMAYASPFIVYYVLIILNERYFKELYVLYPKEWLFPSQHWVMGGFGVILLLTVLCAILCLLFAIIAQRRLANV